MVTVLPGQDFVGVGSNLLVVTAGDSTTYGVDLGPDDIRINNVYGRHMANALSADFLNISQPGVSNVGIAKQIELFAEQLDLLKYQHVYVICTLSEPGRKFDTDEDRHVDYYTWLENNITQSADYHKLLVWLNDSCIQRIYTALAPHNVTLRIGTHIADLIGVDNVKSGDLLAKTMLDVVAEHNNYEFIKGCYVVFPDSMTIRLEHVLTLQPKLKRVDFLRWFMELIDIADVRRKQIKKCGGFDNYHGNELGHKLWADYILGTIKDV